MSLKMFVWHCRCISFASAAQFPEPQCASPTVSRAGPFFSSDASSNWEESKTIHMFRTHSRCVSCAHSSIQCVLCFHNVHCQKTRTDQGIKQIPDQNSFCAVRTKWQSCLATLRCAQTWNFPFWPSTPCVQINQRACLATPSCGAGKWSEDGAKITLQRPPY